MPFTLSAFADEADSSVKGQIDALKRNHIPYVEVRGVNGKNISELSLADAAALKIRFHEEGIRVWSIGSPIGKIPIDGNLNAHFDLFRHTLDLAVKLEAFCIRLFSFYIPNGEDPAVYRDTVVEQLIRYCEAARDSGVTLCHENEKGIYGDIAPRCSDILMQCPGLKAVFDPANFIQCGQSIPEAWRLIAPYVKYLHIKDALQNGTVVPAGEGIGEIPKLLAAFFAQGGEVISLEPHLASFEGLSELERDQKTKLGERIYASNAEAFDAAAHALMKYM